MNNDGSSQFLSKAGGPRGGPMSTKTEMKNFLLERFLLQVSSSLGKAPKRCMSNPFPSHRKFSRGGGTKSTQGMDTTPLDLSVKTGAKSPAGGHGSVKYSKSAAPKGPKSAPTKGPKNASTKELTWKPVSMPAPSYRKREWFPVSKKGFHLPKPGPKFFPISRGGPKRSVNPNHFHWTNSLNHIFLQDRQVSEEHESKDETETAQAQAPATDPKAPDSTSVGPSQTAKGPTTSLKPSVMNPFKMTPSNTWPVDTTEHHSKPILAPPKFNSGFSKLSSSPAAPGFPSSKPMRPLVPPTLSVTSPSETPKPAFKLKPPILGSSISVTSSSFSVKRPAPKVESEGGADSSSPLKGVEESPPDAKRPRTLPSAETSSETPAGTEEKNGSGVSSSTCSAEGKGSSSPTSSSASPSLGRENASSISTTSNTVPTFVPLSSTNMEASSSEESSSRVNGVGATSPPLSSKVGNAGFIFGQNLENRVSGVSSTSSGNTSALRFSNGETNPSSSSSGLNLFTAAASNLAAPSSSCDGGKSLSETSREFSLKEESLKTKYEEVQTVTGEEGEKNVIQMNCKLYGWSNGSWQERGRGILRLNDREIRDELHSRVVIRTQGTLTVMLNAKIWAEMSIEKPTDKSVRFTASDADGLPKIYLVMGSPKDITLLHNSLEYRVAAARSQTLDEKEREADQLSEDTIPSLSV